ncbi:hypothetical protein AYO40_01005 [Planctomycetaceae bacterium SCGC AG-212-D15]|nr:hypothetical protein AYO40_01005 [Planctomycetaceae bacterium SCGC AG-212-D15]
MSKYDQLKRDYERLILKYQILGAIHGHSLMADVVEVVWGAKKPLSAIEIAANLGGTISAAAACSAWRKQRALRKKRLKTGVFRVKPTLDEMEAQGRYVIIHAAIKNAIDAKMIQRIGEQREAVYVKPGD